MRKDVRLQVYQKYNGHCAYCGEEITMGQMQVDHIIPKLRWSTTHGCLIVGGQKFFDYGLNDIRNLNPACRVCNNWKLTYTVEEFRQQIAEQINRLRKYSAGFRMAERYSLVKATEVPIVFWFEINPPSRKEQP